MNQHPPAFWSFPAAELLARLKATPKGLTGDEALGKRVRFRR